MRIAAEPVANSLGALLVFLHLVLASHLLTQVRTVSLIKDNDADDDALQAKLENDREI